MANVIIKLEKKDITTMIIGHNIMVKCTNNLDLVFTPEALEELIKDYKHIKKLEDHE